jgi:hypothetical protein
MGLIAVVVYEKLGVAVLRRAWVDTDAILGRLLHRRQGVDTGDLSATQPALTPSKAATHLLVRYPRTTAPGGRCA